ncbi:MAG: hypothetical protein IH919_08390, partial [Deltaproteobacteria bacterium]|nr:hypothetical protein [Deltaproteobacteria bacterium]
MPRALPWVTVRSRNRRSAGSFFVNPVVTPELMQMAMEPIDHPWFVSGREPVILVVGRLTKQKDFPTL